MSEHERNSNDLIASITAFAADGSLSPEEFDRLSSLLRTVQGFDDEKVQAISRLCSKAKEDGYVSEKERDGVLRAALKLLPKEVKAESELARLEFRARREFTQPTARQLMVLRFWNRMDLAEKSRADISAWLDTWQPVRSQN